MTINQTGLNATEREAWSGLVSQGISRSIAGLTEMVGTEVAITRLDPPWRIAVKDAADLVGGAEALTVAVYLRVSGCATGHMLLVFRPETAFELIDMLLGLAPGTTTDLGDMERSAMGEMGSIMGSFFLNALADSTDLLLMPSPPAVMMDMAGSIIDAALAEIFMEADDLLVERSFGASASHHFACGSCGTHGLAAVPLQCTHCGVETLWGFWPPQPAA